MMLAVIVLLLRIMMLVALFSFLGWTVYTLWRDLKFQSQMLTTRKIPYVSVYRLDDPAGAKQIFTHSELRIGRDPESDIPIKDETVSSRHARLYYRNNQWWLEDLLSTNGTFLNEDKVETPTILVTGDEIRVGKILLKIEIQPAE